MTPIVEFTSSVRDLSTTSLEVARRVHPGAPGDKVLRSSPSRYYATYPTEDVSARKDWCGPEGGVWRRNSHVLVINTSDDDRFPVRYAETTPPHAHRRTPCHRGVGRLPTRTSLVSRSGRWPESSSSRPGPRRTLDDPTKHNLHLILPHTR